MDDCETVKLCKALADENRLKILHLLKNGALCACHLLANLQITQPTLSHHMKLLCGCGLVDYRKEGKWMHDSVAENAHEKISAIIAEYFGEETVGAETLVRGHFVCLYTRISQGKAITASAKRHACVDIFHPVCYNDFVHRTPTYQAIFA